MLCIMYCFVETFLPILFFGLYEFGSRARSVLQKGDSKNVDSFLIFNGDDCIEKNASRSFLPVFVVVR